MANRDETLRELMTGGLDARAAAAIADRIGGQSGHRVASAYSVDRQTIGPAAGFYWLNWGTPHISTGDAYWAPGSVLPLNVQITDGDHWVNYPGDAADHVFSIVAAVDVAAGDPADLHKDVLLNLRGNEKSAQIPLIRLDATPIEYVCGLIDAVFANQSNDGDAAVGLQVQILEPLVAPLAISAVQVVVRELY